MKLVEVKNNLAKVSFCDEDNLVLSGFLVISDSRQPYVAQIMSLKRAADGSFAIAKLLFTYDEEGIVKNYNGSVPSLDSEISVLYSKELLDILPVNIPIKLGTLAQQPFSIDVDREAFENNCLICSNNIANTNVFMQNIIKQFEVKGIKSIIFDLDGQFDFENKIKFSDEFKLPLNYDTINYIYEHDLNDVDATSKAIIQDIFIEVQEYTKTIPDGFIPFDTFMDIVDAQYRETKVGQLILLKNKLLKYKENGVFAQLEKDFKALINIIECGRNIVIDLSDIKTETLQMQIMEYAYGICNQLKVPVYSFVKLDNSYANKPFLKLLTTNDYITTTIIAGHDFKYLRELKSIAKNLVLFAPIVIEHDFASYNTFLNKLNSDEFIFVGDLTQQIPFIVQLESISIDEEEIEDDSTDKIEVINDNSDELVEDLSSDAVEEPLINDGDTEQVEVLESDNEDIIVENIDEIELVEPETLELEPVSVEENFEIIEETEDADDMKVSVEPENLVETEEDFVDELVDNSDISIVGSEDMQDSNKVDEVDELAISDSAVIENSEDEDSVLNEDSLNVLYEVNSEENIVDSDEDEASVLKSLDEFEPVIVENIIPDKEPVVSFEEEQVEMNDEEDEIEIIDIQDQEIEQEVVDDTPIIPVYQADELKNSSLEFESGERVSHPKYGEGVVEKMINYGNKKLCSVIFSGDRRRLLDPAISELTRLS